MTDLRCPACDREFAAGPNEPWRCTCGGPLEIGPIRIRGEPPEPSALDTRKGRWGFSDSLPVAPRVTLGEGMTPLVDAPRWGAAFKLEYLSPTGSFKDRGAATTISRAVELGATRVVEDSSGNAGAAIAAYAARAGIDAEVFVPDDAPPAKLRLIERTGAELVRIQGSREAVAAACIDRAEGDGVWYASHAWNPAFLVGTATFALEVCAARGWRAPDAVIQPVGHGTLLLGAYRGFSALHDAGLIDRIPRVLCAQAAGYAPIVSSLGESRGGDSTNHEADGLRIREPVRLDEVLEAVRTTGGAAVAVGGRATRAAVDRLAREGFHVEPTAAVAPAAISILREQGVLDTGDDVVVPLTGSGLKVDVRST